MSDHSPAERTDHDQQAQADYEPPAITYLGDLATLTKKTVGGVDGSTFLGLDIGSI